MPSIIKIEAYKFEELSNKSQEYFINSMWDIPFEYETGERDQEGNLIIENDYFGDWNFQDQVDFCEANKYLFSKYGKLIGHLAIN